MRPFFSLVSRYLKPSAGGAQTRRNRHRPTLEVLEDRTVPSRLAIVDGGGAARGTLDVSFAEGSVFFDQTLSVAPGEDRNLFYGHGRDYWGFHSEGGNLRLGIIDYPNPTTKLITLVAAAYAPRNDTGFAVVGQFDSHAQASASAVYRILPEGIEQFGDPILVDIDVSVTRGASGFFDERPGLRTYSSDFSYSISGAATGPGDFLAHIGDEITVQMGASGTASGSVLFRSSLFGGARIEVSLRLAPAPANSAPELGPIGNRAVEEGSTLSFGVTATDRNPGNTLTFSLAPGAPAGASINPNTGQFTFQAGDGPASYEVTVRVKDNGSPALEDFETFTINVGNIAPVITSVSPSSAVIDEGQSVTVSGAFADPGLAFETFSGTAIWSDGISTPVSIAGTTFSSTRAFPDDDPSGTASDLYSVSIAISDGDGDSDTASTSVEVRNVAPTLTGLSATPILENGVTLLTGAIADLGAQDIFTVVVDWSDGIETFTNVPAGIFSFTRHYLDDNPTGTALDNLPIRVRVTDDDGGSVAAETTLQVSNVAPTLSDLVTTPTMEGGGSLVTGIIADVGTRDTFTMVIDWGNGIETFPRFPAGPFIFTRQYLDDDPTGTPVDKMPISITVTDDDTSSVTMGTTVEVTNVAPSVTGLSATSILEGGDTVLTGTIADMGPQDTFTVMIDWGNGIEIVNGVSAGTFSYTREYLDDDPTGTSVDNMPIRVTVTDDDTGSVTADTSVQVRNVAPILFPIAGQTSGVRGQVRRFVSGSFTDPGTLDTHSEVWRVRDAANVIVGAGVGRVFDYTPTAVGTYTVTFTVADDDGGGASATLMLVVSIVQLQADPVNPGKQVLVIGGSPGDDAIRVQPGNPPETIRVIIDERDSNVRHEATLDPPIHRVVILGQAGNDVISMSGRLAVPAWLYGGTGDDMLLAAGGHDVLLGGDGDDLLVGGDGRDILIGGVGSDLLVGNGEDDILIAGSTAHDADEAALASVAAEWTSARGYAERVANLTNGNGSPARANGDVFLDNATVWDDGVRDVLIGSSGRDWFLLNRDGEGLAAPDLALDIARSELFSDIDFS